MADDRPLVGATETKRLQPGDRLEVESIVSPSTLTFESSAVAAWTLKQVHDLIAWATTTGLISGGEVIKNGGNPALFDYAAGTGETVDNKTDSANPDPTPVTWAGATGVTLTFLGSSPATTLLISSAGALVQLPRPILPEERRTHICLAVILHPSGSEIRSVAFSPLLAYGLGPTVYDFFDLLGELNVSGNIFSANGANLRVDKTVGSAWVVSGNLGSDKNNPNFPTVASITDLAEYTLTYQDGVGGFVSVAAIALDPAQRDNGSGTLVALGANKFQIIVLKLAAETNDVIAEYGQAEYNSMALAEAAIAVAIVENPQTANLIRRTWLIVRNTTTALNNATDAKFVTVPNLDVGNAATGGGTAGSGDVVGPASAVDDNLTAFDGATGKLLKDSGITAASVSGHLGSTSNPHSTSIANIGSGTLAQLNAQVSDATLDANTASRPPNGAAGGGLGGTYPNPTVNADASKLDVVTSIRATTGTSETVAVGDNGGVITCDNASTITLTVPVGLGDGFSCQVIQLGAGVVTPTESSTTINNSSSHTTTRAQHSAISLTSYAVNIFNFQGDTA